MGVHYDAAAKNWVATFYDGESRPRVRTRSTKVLAEVAMILRAGARSQADLAGASLNAFIQVMLAELRDRGASYSTLNRTDQNLRHRLASDMLERAISSFRPDDMDAVHRGWQAGQIAATTIRNSQCQLEAVFECAWRRGAVAENVARNVFSALRPTIDHVRTPKLAADHDVASLRRAAVRLDHRALLETIIETRPSVHELAAVRCDDLDLQAGTVTYRFVLNAGHEVEHYNPYRIRTVPLGAAREHLIAWLDSIDRPSSEYVFCRANGLRRLPSEISAQVARIQFDAGQGREGATDVGLNWKHRVSAFQRATPRYTVMDLGNGAVLNWYRQGLRGRALAARMGCTLWGLAKFQPLFDEIDQDDEVVRRAGQMLGAEQ
jgi:hypothetical protein